MPTYPTRKATNMNAILMNVLVNAAKSTNQDVNKTLKLVAKMLNTQQLDQVRTLMQAGIKINHNNVKDLF